MTSNAENIARIRADFLVWLQQNDDQGDAWFLDEGAPPVPDAPPGPEPAAPPAAEMAPPAPEPSRVDGPVVNPGHVNTDDLPLPPGLDPADPFAAECRQFVGRTLESIRRHGAPAVEQMAEAEAVRALDELRGRVAPCTACALHTGRTRTVFGAGNPRAGVLLIGEAPGRDEDLQGEPFVGRSGQLLKKILEAIGFARQDVYICNILKCRPPNNRDPLPEEVACCEPFLKEQLAVIRPRVICCLGRIAAQTLLKTEASLRSLRETVHFYEGIPVMATYHPAALLRNPGWKRETWNDVRKLRALHDALPAASPPEE